MVRLIRSDLWTFVPPIMSCFTEAIRCSQSYRAGPSNNKSDLGVRMTLCLTLWSLTRRKSITTLEKNDTIAMPSAKACKSVCQMIPLAMIQQCLARTLSARTFTSPISLNDRAVAILSVPYSVLPRLWYDVFRDHRDKFWQWREMVKL